MQVIIDVNTIIGLIFASILVTGVVYAYHRVKGKEISVQAWKSIESSWVFTLNITIFFFLLYFLRSI